MSLRHPRTWALWDILYPPLCSVCGKTLEKDAVLFCMQCWADAPIPEVKDFPKLRHVDMVRSGYYFAVDNMIRAAVHALKYEGQLLLAREMARHLIPRLPTRFVEAEVTWVSVPLHWQRKMIRGFNQSDAIANALAIETGHRKPERLLKRIRHTPTQTALTYTERAANMKGAFAVKTNIKVPSAVLLIDDVITTGATIDECALTLKNAGTEWVGALSFAFTQNR
jgi:competence protein ComFC